MYIYIVYSYTKGKASRLWLKADCTLISRLYIYKKTNCKQTLAVNKL